MQRESLVSIRVRAADPAWLCIIHWSLCITKSIKAFLENKGRTSFSEIWLPLCLLFFFCFSGWIPIWNIKAHRVYLFAWASKTHMRGSPMWGTLRYSSGCLWPYVDGVSPFSLDFIDFLCKPRNISLFLSYIFPTAIFLLYLSLYL